jgi:hypothetical protein
MNPLNKFYIHVPQDQHWDTGYPKTVFQGVEEPMIPQMPWYKIRVCVIAPTSFANKYPNFYRFALLECAGPARKLTLEEYVELVHGLIPEHPLPRRYKLKASEVFQNTMLVKSDDVSQVGLRTTFANLLQVKSEAYYAFYDLVMKCKNDAHRFVKAPYGDSQAVLEEFGLIEDGVVHEDVKTVVLRSITGNGLEMSLEAHAE